SHNGGVSPPCTFDERLWSVTAKYLSPRPTTALAIVFTDALPSDQAVCKCRSESKSLATLGAKGSRDSASAHTLLPTLLSELGFRMALQPIRCRIAMHPSCPTSRRKNLSCFRA